MRYTAEQAPIVLAEIHHALATDESDDRKIRRAWATMAYLRGSVLASMVANTIGKRVYSGPFKGMQLTPETLQGAYAPYLLGTYEHELHPAFEQAMARSYTHILNIGCSFGYYSTGLALRMPQVTVHAFDIDEKCQQKCRDMAALNQVQDRIQIGGEFHGADFANYPAEKTLVVMDIEGAEVALLKPDLYPPLQKMDVIVELHDLFGPSISDAITPRFAATHDIEILRNRTILFDFESIMGPAGYMDPFDALIATWERRDGPTPWAVMRRKSFNNK